jgi:hypothetical protein
VLFALCCCVVFPSEGNHRVDAGNPFGPPTSAFANGVGVVIVKLSAY